MATFIALLLALGVYTGTVAGVNHYLAPVPGSPLSFDIYQALEGASRYAANLGVPDPGNWAAAGLALILPALISFAIVRFIVR